jgi:vacuolar-type H+-ATPase subunit C/Vma6
VIDVFAAHQDRRSLRALLRGAAQGAPAETRLRALIPTRSLPQAALNGLARQASPAAVVAQLTLMSHPDARRLRPLVRQSQPDVGAIDHALLAGFADRASRAAGTDEATRDWVAGLIDTGNAQRAVLVAVEPRDVDPADAFVRGGRWISADTFSSAATSGESQRALAILASAVAHTPFAALLPVTAGEIARLDGAFLESSLARLARTSRLDPLGTAPLLRLLLLLEAQSRDLRTLAWGAALGTPVSLRRQQLVTPS